MTQYALSVNEIEVERYRLMAEMARELEADAWKLAGIVPGAVVADVGCGPGAVSVVMAELVGPTGRVIGIERDEAALAAARQLVKGARAANVELRSGTATATGLAASSVDVAVLRHVLAHNGGQEQAIVRHLASRVRPGGCVYLVDTDITAFRVLDMDSGLADMGDRYTKLHQVLGNDPSVGLRLGKLITEAGLDLLRHLGRYQIFEPPPGLRAPPWAAREAMLGAAAVTTADLARWEAAFERTDAQTPRPTMFNPQFIAIGRRRT
jgi:ubiquinone/menaquinone biosynthesis C-methylase UbiE